MKYEQIYIAEQQLERALKLFLDEKDYISSITLAGAAEDIIAKTLRDKGGKSSFESLKGVFYVANKSTGTPDRSNKESDKVFNQIANGVRNGLKHYSAGVPLEFDPVQEASNMLDRATSDYFCLTGNETELMRRFKECCLSPTYPLDNA